MQFPKQLACDKRPQENRNLPALYVSVTEQIWEGIVVYLSHRAAAGGVRWKVQGR